MTKVSKKKLSFRLDWNRRDGAAVILAVLLSLACLAKGAVHDSVVAVLLFSLIPVLWLVAGGDRLVHQPLKCLVGGLLTLVLLVLALQWLVAGGSDLALWQAVTTVTGQEVKPVTLQDKAAWYQGWGRLLLLVMTFTAALFIGTYESSARLFFQALLVSGTCLVAFTFFSLTSEGVPTTTFYSYRHGFVNPNNAAAYLGIMLLIGVGQAIRFLRIPSGTFYKSLMNMIDQINLWVLTKVGFVIISILLALAGLLMTGSRGGILVTFVCGLLFLHLMVRKIRLERQFRNLILMASMLFGGLILIWSFMNFGHILNNKFAKDGISSNTRMDIAAAVIPMIADHPLLGVGLGGFPGAFQAYRPRDISSDGIIDKAHNSYLEFASEMGIPAFIALMLVLGWVGRTLYRGYQERQERYVMSATGLSVWLFAALYSLMDFPLQIPALAALFTAIMTICVSQTDRRFSEPTTHRAHAPRKRVRVRKRGRSGNTK